MAPNKIFISNAQSAPGLSITPAGLPAGVGGNPPSNAADEISITSASGTQEIRSYTIDASGGEDTVILFGSPILNDVDLGDGNDLFSVDTYVVGGSVNTSTVKGGDGNDTFNILTGAGTVSSLFEGGEGKDLFNLKGQFSQVTLNGGGGNDTLTYLDPGTTGESALTNSLVNLGAGADTLTDGEFPLNVEGTTVNAGAGRDTVVLISSIAGKGADGILINGGGGADMLYGPNSSQGSAEASVFAGAGNDFVQTFHSDDTVVGGGGTDTLLLGDGDDDGFGDVGNDILLGQDGDDTLDGGEGRDAVLGGEGDDDMYGGDGDYQDLLIGEADDDTIDGGSGGDIIFGDSFNTISMGEDASGSSITNDVGHFVLGYQPSIVTGTNGDGAFLTGILDYDHEDVSGARQGPILEEVVGYVGGEWNTINLADPEPLNPDGPSFVQWDQAPGDTPSTLTKKTSTQPAVSPFTSQSVSVTGTILANDEGGLLLDLMSEGALMANLAKPGTFDSVGKTQPVDQPGVDIVDFNRNTAGNDVIDGNSGVDTIFGGAGDDVIDGGLDNDIIVGGVGSDIMTGGSGSDVFVQGEDASYVVSSASLALGGNWTFNFDAPGGFAPDVITDFQITSNAGSPIDKVAFDISGNPEEAWEATNTNTMKVRNLVGTGAGLWNADEVVIFRGTYNETSGQFTTQNNVGDDVLVFRADNGTGTDKPVGDLGTQAVILDDVGDQLDAGRTFVAGNFFGGPTFTNDPIA